MNPLLEEQLESLADKTRIRWGIHDQRCPDVVTMIYKLKKEGSIMGYVSQNKNCRMKKRSLIRIRSC